MTASEAGAPAAPDKPELTRRERIFCDLYLTGLSGADAVRKMQERSKKKSARPDQVAWRFLQRPAVREYIRARRADIEDATGVRQEVHIRRLDNIVQTTIAALYDEKGDFKPIHTLPPEIAAAIKSVEYEETVVGEGNDKKVTRRISKVELYNPREANDAVARQMGWNRDKVELDLKNAAAPVINVAVYDDDAEVEREARAAVSRKPTAT